MDLSRILIRIIFLHCVYIYIYIVLIIFSHINGNTLTRGTGLKYSFFLTSYAETLYVSKSSSPPLKEKSFKLNEARRHNLTPRQYT